MPHRGREHAPLAFMAHRNKDLHETLTKLTHVGVYVLEHGGVLTHAQTEGEYRALGKKLLDESHNELASEFRELHQAIDRVLADSGNASVLAELTAALDHANVVLADDKYSALRAPMRSGFMD